MQYLNIFGQVAHFITECTDDDRHAIWPCSTILLHNFHYLYLTVCSVKNTVPTTNNNCITRKPRYYKSHLLKRQLSNTLKNYMYITSISALVQVLQIKFAFSLVTNSEQKTHLNHCKAL